MHPQTLSSMRPSPRPHHGCAMGVQRDPALNAYYGQTAPLAPLIMCGSVPGHRSRTSGSRASVTNSSCQYPLCAGQLALLDIGAVVRVAGRPSDGDSRREVMTTTLTRRGHCAACRTHRVHRYGVAVSVHVGDASEWRCVMPLKSFTAAFGTSM